MLRPMTADDLKMVLEWRNQAQVRENMYTTHEITWEEHVSWWSRVSENKKFKFYIFEEGIPRGVVSFSELDEKNRTAIWAFYTGPDAPKGIGSRMEAAALEMAFEGLGLYKLVGEVLSHNMRVVKLHRRFGFKLEGIYRQQYTREDGRRLDVYRVAMFANDYTKFLKEHAGTIVKQERITGINVGDRHVVSLSYTADQIAEFARVSGDVNPVHLDDNAAQSQGFKQRIAHGILPCAEISRVLGTEFPGKGTIFVGLQIQFVKPVYPDTKMELVLEVISRIGSRFIIGVNLLTDTSDSLLVGECEVLYRQG